MTLTQLFNCQQDLVIMAMTLNLKPVFCLLLIFPTLAVAVNFPDSIETFIFSGILIHSDSNAHAQAHDSSHAHARARAHAHVDHLHPYK